MPTIGTTRFNTQTWKENTYWREKNNYNGCIYGSPVRTNDNIIKDDIAKEITKANEDYQNSHQSGPGRSFTPKQESCHDERQIANGIHGLSPKTRI